MDSIDTTRGGGGGGWTSDLWGWLERDKSMPRRKRIARIGCEDGIRSSESLVGVCERVRLSEEPGGLSNPQAGPEAAQWTERPPRAPKRPGQRELPRILDAVRISSILSLVACC